MKRNTGVRYKSVFISDLHLGSKHCNSDALLDFLEDLNTENLFLVGDIIDGWRLSKKWYWPKKHNKIIRKLLKISEKSNVVYITGNHDEFFRTFPNVQIGKVAVENRYTYYGIDGKKYLVTHGDMFDNLMRTKAGRMLMHVGDIAYDSLIYINRLVNFSRRMLRMRPWSLAKYLKKRAKAATSFISKFSLEMANYCKRKGYDGVICGHIHHAEIVHYQDVVYMNDGDWCESCTALVEHLDGTWEIISVHNEKV
jgi:UDP-2,3-diacylglucosamine pyrophosphatase LpxH